MKTLYGYRLSGRPCGHEILFDAARVKSIDLVCEIYDLWCRSVILYKVNVLDRLSYTVLELDDVLAVRIPPAVNGLRVITDNQKAFEIGYFKQPLYDLHLV